MERAKIKLSIVIISRNICDVLQDCLSKIPDAVGELDHEVIVVDNNSSDGNVEMVRSVYPAVRLIENSENHGFSKAANQGILGSSGRYIAILNADTLPSPKSLEKLVEHLDDNPEVAAVGPQLIGRFGHQQYSGGFAPSPVAVFRQLVGLNYLMGNRARGVGVRARRSSKQAMSLDWLSGAFLVVRRQATEDVGGLDETLFMYAEDVEYGLRLRRNGWKLHLVPWVKVVHYGGLSGAKIPEAKVLWIWALFRIAEKNLSPSAYRVFGLLMSSLFLSRYLIVKITDVIPGARHGSRVEVANSVDFRKYAATAFKLGVRGPKYISAYYTMLEDEFKHGQEAN